MKAETRPKELWLRVVHNTLALIGGDVFYHAINFVTGILVARSLGSERYGQFSFIFAYLSFFEIFVHFGMNSILTRELAQRQEETGKILGSAFLIRLVLSLVGFAGSFFLIRALDYPFSVQQGVQVASFQLFLGLRSVYETIFRAHLLMIYPALVNTVRAAVNLALVWLLAQTQPTVFGFVLVYLVTGAAGFIAIIPLSHRTVRFSLEWDPKLAWRIFRESAPLLLSGYLTLLYYRIDVLMLSKMKGFSEVGYYSVATRLTEALDIIATGLMVSLFPLLSRAFKENREEFDKILKRSFHVLLLIGLPMAVGGSFLAKDLIGFLFGSAYDRSGVTLGILFWYTFFGFFSTFCVNVLIVCGKQRVDTGVSFLLVLGNIGMNLLLIPSFSYNGAALATVLTEVFGLTLMWTYAKRNPEIRLSLSWAELEVPLKINGLFLLLVLIVKVFFPIPVYASAALLAGGYLLLLWISGVGKSLLSHED